MIFFPYSLLLCDFFRFDTSTKSALFIITKLLGAEVWQRTMFVTTMVLIYRTLHISFLSHLLLFCFAIQWNHAGPAGTATYDVSHWAFTLAPSLRNLSLLFSASGKVNGEDDYNKNLVTHKLIVPIFLLVISPFANSNMVLRAHCCHFIDLCAAGLLNVHMFPKCLMRWIKLPNTLTYLWKKRWNRQTSTRNFKRRHWKTWKNKRKSLKTSKPRYKKCKMKQRVCMVKNARDSWTWSNFSSSSLLLRYT